MEYSVCICTFRRPELLDELLHALRLQEFPVQFEIIVVDNDPDASALAILQQHQSYWSDRLVIRHCPVPNISVSRNAAIAAAKGNWLALIDDDELPAPDWLSQLSNTAKSYQAEVVFAPVVPRYLPTTKDWLIRGAYFERPRMITGTRINHKNARSGNVLVAKSLLMQLYSRNGFVFDPALGRTGGEDSLLFRQLDLAGARMIWCDEAPVTELVPEDRARAGWLLSRSYRTGALFLQTELVMCPAGKRTVRALELGVRALVQSVLALVFALLLLPVRPLKAFRWLRICISQLGKLSVIARKPPEVYGIQSKRH